MIVVRNIQNFESIRKKGACENVKSENGITK